MSKYTKGPWFIRTKQGHYEIYQKGWKAYIGETHDKANAKLIASAPELLEACKEAARLYDELALSLLAAAAKYGPNYEPPTDEEWLEMRKELKQAIAKAEKD